MRKDFYGDAPAPGGASFLWFESPSHNPAFNLALEETLFLALENDTPGYFFLWQNEPSIIIGRHQNAREVARAETLALYNLPLLRRISGGGAVYHDLGNLNFSFIVNGATRIDFERFLLPVRRALANLGLNAVMSGRNDLEIHGQKIGGNAQFISGRKLLHHGTLLVNLNIARMSEALAPDANKLKNRGVASMAARVANLGDLASVTTVELKKALIAACAAKRGKISASILTAAETLAARKYATRAWNYGRESVLAREKRERFPWGEICARLKLSGDKIASVEINGDFFNQRPIKELEAKFADVKLTREALAKVLASVEWEKYFAGCYDKIMANFFANLADF